MLYASLALGSLAVLGCAPSRRQALGPPAPVWPLDRGPMVHRQASRATPNIKTTPPAAAVPGGIFPRSTWTTSGPTLALANRMGRIERITIHHDAMASSGFRTANDSKVRLNDILRAHRNNGWADIGYHYAIDPLGNVWSARPIQLQGAHVRDWNERNLGVMVMGNFMHEQPTPQALAALHGLIRSESGRYRVPAGRVGTHRELATTACPGDALQRKVDAARANRLPGFA